MRINWSVLILLDNKCVHQVNFTFFILFYFLSCSSSPGCSFADFLLGLKLSSASRSQPKVSARRFASRSNSDASAASTRRNKLPTHCDLRPQNKSFNYNRGGLAAASTWKQKSGVTAGFKCNTTTERPATLRRFSLQPRPSSQHRRRRSTGIWPQSVWHVEQPEGIAD